MQVERIEVEAVKNGYTVKRLLKGLGGTDYSKEVYENRQEAIDKVKHLADDLKITK